MDVELIANGSITIVLIPKTPMEEEALKLLVKQENEIVEIRSGATVLNRTISQGILIRKAQETKEVELSEKPEENQEETDEAEDLQ